MHMRGSWDASQGPLGGLLGASGGPLGLLGGLLGASWEPLGGLVGLLVGASGASGGLLGPSWGERLEVSVRISPLGLPWGPLGALLGRLGGPRGRLRAPLGRLWALLGVCPAVVERSGAVFGRPVLLGAPQSSVKLHGVLQGPPGPDFQGPRGRQKVPQERISSRENVEILAFLWGVPIAGGGLSQGAPGPRRALRRFPRAPRSSRGLP